MLTAEDAAARALAVIRGYCGWQIFPEVDETLTLDGSGTCSMVLPSLRITAVSDLVNDGTAVEPNNYDWSESGIIELRCGRFTRRLRGVTLTVASGYTYLPDEIQDVADRLADRALAPTGNVQQVGQVRYGTGSDGVGLGLSLSAYDRDLLAPYKLPSRP